MQWSNFSWRKDVFSDEKRFELDGLGGNASYWADLSVQRRVLTRRQRSGGGVMVWARFSAKGVLTSSLWTVLSTRSATRASSKSI